MPNKKEILRIEKENQEKLQRIGEKFEILEGALVDKIETEKKLLLEIERLKQNQKGGHKVIANKITEPIEVKSKKEDKFNTRPEGKNYENTISNLRRFTSVAYRNYIRSKMMWILLIALPMFMTLLQHYAFTSGYWSAENQILNFFNPFDDKLAAALINWFITMPLLVFGLMIFPTFLTQCREDNFLKRFTMIGMSKKQMYWFYLISSSTLMILFMMFFLGPWVMILDLTTSSMLNEEIWTSPWQMFNTINLLSLLILTLVGMLAINSVGFKKGMKAKSSRSVVGWGAGLWIFTQFSTIAVISFGVQFWNGDIWNIDGGWETFIIVLLLVLKWMFVFTIPSLINMSIMLTSGASNLGADMIGQLGEFTLIDEPEKIYALIQIVTLVIALLASLLVFIKKEKITSFETAR